MMEAGRYNFRSNRRECSIPVQLQLATDDKLLTETGRRAESPQAGQVLSEFSDSESDIDLSDLIRHSDQNLSLTFVQVQSARDATGGNSIPGPSGSNPSTSDQMVMNHN